MNSKKLSIAVLAVSLIAPAVWLHADPATTAAPAAGTFAKKHPRRAEVNRRVRNQNKRINQGVKSGELTSAQAQQLKANDAAIKSQERADVKANGGYLTKPEQKQLNQEENANSKLIKDEKHPAGQ